MCLAKYEIVEVLPADVGPSKRIGKVEIATIEASFDNRFSKEEVRTNFS